MVSSTVIPRTETNLNGDNVASNRRGDGSFAAQLRIAESKLGVFGFDLDSLFAADADSNLKIQLEDNLPENKPSQKGKPEATFTDSKNSQPLKTITDVKELKNLLIQNLPASHLFTLPSFYFGDTFLPQPILKADLQILIDELVEQARLLKINQKVELTLNLSEETLGNILLSLTSRQGVVSIQISANSQTQAYLKDHQSELEMALNLAEIPVDEVKIIEIGGDKNV